MAWPTVTNTFAAGTRAIASKVNQNFTDLKNAIGLTYDLASANYPILDTDGYRYILVTTGASDRTITLPTVADNEDRVITIVKIDSDAGQVIVDGESSETIDGEANYTISDQYGSVTVKSNGSAWYKIYGGATGTGGAAGRNYLEDWFDASKNIGTVTNGLGNTLDTSDRTGDKTTWGSSNTSLLTIARSTSSPLRQTYSYLITEAGSSSGAFIESPLFSLDAVDLGKPVTVSFDCADNAVSDDYQVYMCRYDSNDVLKERIVIVGTASATSPYSARIPTGTTKFQGFFIAGSTSTDQYALRIVSNSNSAASIKVDSLYVGPEKVVQGAGISDPVVYTPTYSTNAPSVSASSKTIYARTGKYLDLYLNLVFTGAGSDGNPFTASFPSTVSIDTNYIATTALSIGFPCEWYDASVASGAKTKAIMARVDATNNKLSFFETTDAGTGAQINNNTIASGDSIEVALRVPITGWSSNVTMADRAVEEYAYNSGTWDTASDTTSFGYGPSGAAIGGSLSADAVKYVQFKTPILPTDKIFLEYKNPSTNTWVDAANSIYPGVNLPSVAFGAQIYYDLVSTNQVKVYFNRYAKAGTTYNSLTGAINWSAAGQSHWRVRKVSGGAAVGYPISPANITKSIARYTTNAAQSIDNAGSGEVIDFEDKVFDTKNNVTTGASWKFTASEAGYYRVSATVLLNNGGGWAATEAASISIRRSGTIYSRADAYQTATHSTYVTCHVDDVVYLENGQYVDILIYQNSGGAITLFNSNDYNYVSIEQVM